MKGPSLYPKVTTTGYRKDSPDVDNEQNLIPSNEISMKENDGKPLEKGKIKGVGTTTGQTKIMKPGEEYTFEGDESVLETPLEQDVLWKSKLKTRKDGTFRKVVTKDKRGSGNKEGNYRSVIKFDKEGKIRKAKSNKTKNKLKKSKRRLNKAKWIKRDMSPYDSMYTTDE